MIAVRSRKKLEVVDALHVLYSNMTVHQSMTIHPMLVKDRLHTPQHIDHIPTPSLCA